MGKSKWLLNIGLLICSHIAFAEGGSVSGGADSYVITPAYFRSSDPNQKIALCYEVSSDFGVPVQELEGMLRWAFAEWDAYIEAKDLHYAIWTGSPGIVGKLGKLTLGCQGNEDLRVYFGVKNSDVAKYRPRLLNPYAFSAIVSPSQDGRWNKGLLWVVNPGAIDPKKGIPTWNKPSRIPYGALKYLVLHEIGHVFGNGHVDWTIMTSRIGQWMENWTNAGDLIFRYHNPSERDLRIDQQEELVPNLNLSAEYILVAQEGCFNSDGKTQCPDLEPISKVYEKIFGKSPRGEVAITAKRMENPGRKLHSRPDQVEGGTGNLEVTFTDSYGTHKVRVITVGKVAQKDVSTPLFNGQHGNHFRSFGASFSGYLETPGGRKIPVLVNYNMNRRLSIIEFPHGTEERPLLLSLF